MDEKFEKLNYRIGLDIGIASVGWAALLNNSKDEPVHILDMGVRIFDTAEIPKTGEALAGPRRAARTGRRRIRRRRHRLERIKNLLQEENLISVEGFMKRYHEKNLPDVYELRYEGLNRKLTEEELAQVLIHIAKHRGFKSTRKAERESKENGQVLAAVSANKALMIEKGYRTVGQMFYCDETFHKECPWNEKGYVLAPRNKSEDYKHTVLRDMLVEEVHTIFEAQRELGNLKASKELEKKYLDIMTSQRSFDMGPGNQPDGSPSPYAMEGFADRVGKCTFEKEEMRAPKAAYTSELFVVMQKINNIRLLNQAGESIPLTEEQRKRLLDAAHEKKELSYSQVRKLLETPYDIKFKGLNYSSKKNTDDSESKIKETEKAKVLSMPCYHTFSKILNERVQTLEEQEWMDLYDKVAGVLTLYKNDDSRTKRLCELGLNAEEIDHLLGLTPSKFQHISIKAMQKILPFLKEGMTYDKACKAAGYDFRDDAGRKKTKLLKGEAVNAIINDITNPVVKRSVSQTVKVINAIIQKYGSPQAINIELAREMSKPFAERKKLESGMKDNQEKNGRVKKRIEELGRINPTGQDIIKYRLWEEQQGICLYSKKPIPLEELFGDGYDIDHILPYSITFDDSFRNKVLVRSDENRQKGNRTPFEYMESDDHRWSDFETLVSNYIKDYRKQERLLKRHITEEEKSEFKERNLTDTKYITTVVYNLIRQNLELTPLNTPGKKKQVIALNGSITAYLRKRWGIKPKNRETDTHHSVDAVVIACCTDGMIQKISKYSKGRELAYIRDFKFIDEETGEILNRDNFSREKWDEKYGAKVPLPWPSFRHELAIRSEAEDPIKVLENDRKVRNEIGYPDWMYDENYPIIRPIFVSKMPNHKVSGAAHEETIRSPKIYKEEGKVLLKTPLTSLKLDKDHEIVDYYDPDSDRLLYNALKHQLLLYGGDAKKAFAEEFHKPKSDGTEGPVVKKVKICSKQTAGVYTNQGTGIAKNGSMVRIDVFQENEKYYFVPIYTADVVKKVLPNKAASAGKNQEDWKQMKDENFLFSLYSRDLVHIKSKKGIKLNGVDGGQVNIDEVYSYFISADISTVSISISAHDSSYTSRGIGIQGLQLLEKCNVDVLGNVSVVKKERRMSFS